MRFDGAKDIVEAWRRLYGGHFVLAEAIIETFSR
jgi:hypothetical protein